MAVLTGHLFSITSAASRIRRATAKLMANSGAPVALADMDAKAVQPLTRTLKENGASAYSMFDGDEVECMGCQYNRLHFAPLSRVICRREGYVTCTPTRIVIMAECKEKVQKKK